jgi:acyl-CoA thioester hydrolase
VPSTWADPGARPILGRATVDFRSPVTYPDTVTVEAGVSRLGTTSFTMRYRATSRAQGRLVAEGDAVVVMVDPETGQKTPLSKLRRNNPWNGRVGKEGDARGRVGGE